MALHVISKLAAGQLAFKNVSIVISWYSWSWTKRNWTHSRTKCILQELLVLHLEYVFLCIIHMMRWSTIIQSINAHRKHEVHSEWLQFLNFLERRVLYSHELSNPQWLLCYDYDNTHNMDVTLYNAFVCVLLCCLWSFCILLCFDSCIKRALATFFKMLINTM